MRRILFLLFPLLVMFPWQAPAASFKVVPMFVLLDPQQNRGVLTVVNNDPDKLTIQLRLMKWTQDAEGRDVYEPSKDLVFYPQIVTLDGKREKIVRVGYEGSAAAATEKTYRLFLQELPVQKPGDNVLRMALRVAIPVFIAPANPAPKISVEGLDVVEGMLRLKVKNSGNSHAMIPKIRITGLDAAKTEVFSRESTGWYVLSGSVRAFPVDIVREDFQNAAALAVSLEVGDTTVEGDVPVDPSLSAAIIGAEEKRKKDEQRSSHGENR